MADVIVNTIPEMTELITKIIILFVFLLFFLYLKYNSKNIDKDRSFYNYLYWVFSNYITMVYIFISPFTFLLLNSNISFEMFIWFVVSIYMIFGVMGLFLLSLFAKDSIVGYISKENSMDRRERKKYAN